MGLTWRARNEIIVSSVMFGLASLAVFLRFLAVVMMRKGVNISDVFTGISWIVLLALVIQIILWAAIGGNGQHITALDPHQVTLFFKIFYANQITYTILAPSIKLFMIFYYRAVFAVRNFRIAADIVATIFAAWGIAILLAAIFQCTPIRAFWDPPVGKCFDQTAYLYGVQYPNIIFDFTLLFMPIPVIWRIKRPFKDRLALLCVFSLGGLGCVSGIVRVIVLGQINRADITYTIYQGTLWTLVEPCIALICGSLPIIYGFIRLRFNQQSTSHGKSSGFSTQGRKSTSKQPAAGDGEDALRVVVSRKMSATSSQKDDDTSDRALVPGTISWDHSEGNSKTIPMTKMPTSRQSIDPNDDNLDS